MRDSGTLRREGASKRAAEQGTGPDPDPDCDSTSPPRTASRRPRTGGAEQGHRPKGRRSSWGDRGVAARALAQCGAEGTSSCGLIVTGLRGTTSLARADHHRTTAQRLEPLAKTSAKDTPARRRTLRVALGRRTPENRGRRGKPRQSEDRSPGTRIIEKEGLQGQETGALRPGVPLGPEWLDHSVTVQCRGG